MTPAEREWTDLLVSECARLKRDLAQCDALLGAHRRAADGRAVHVLVLEDDLARHQRWATTGRW